MRSYVYPLYCVYRYRYRWYGEGGTQCAPSLSERGWTAASAGGEWDELLYGGVSKRGVYLRAM